MINISLTYRKVHASQCTLASVYIIIITIKIYILNKNTYVNPLYFIYFYTLL